jgi:hypothetical protein
VSTRNLDSKTTKTGREKVNDSKCNLAKTENLYRNLFIQAPEIDGQIIIEESDVEVGQLLPMLITESTHYDLVARLSTTQNA